MMRHLFSYLLTVCAIHALSGGICSPPEIPAPQTKVAWDIVRTGSGEDGGGLCVNACVETLARHHGISALTGFHGWSRKYTGGSYPEKLDRQLEHFCRESRVGMPTYISSEHATWKQVVNATSRGFPCIIAVNGDLPHYGVGVCTTVILVQVRGHMTWIVDPCFPEYGVFTIPSGVLQKCYEVSPWVVFLPGSAQTAKDINNILRPAP